MKTTPECISCFIHDIQGALESIGAEASFKERFLKKCLDILNEELNFESIPSVFITELHRALKAELGVDDPFSILRDQLNQLGIGVREKIERATRALEGKALFRAALLWSISANHLDIRTAGAGYGGNVADYMKKMEEIVQEGLFIDDSLRVYQLIQGADVLFIHDNVGEIAVDCFLIDVMKRTGARRVVSALRTGPLTSDATLEDGIRVGIGNYADEVIPASGDTLGVLPEEMTQELQQALRACDLVVTKGQANFYSFDEIKENITAPLCFLLRTKCMPVARRFGAEEEAVNICWVWEK